MNRFIITALCYLAMAFPLHSQEWVSRGKCAYTDDFINACFLNAGCQTYSVEVEESTSTEHLYRLVNPYGKAYPLNNPGDYATDTRYMYIHAENPAQVYIERFATGMNWLGYGEITLSSRAAEELAKGSSAAEIDPALFGSHKNDCITFPKGTLLISVPSANHGNFIEANLHGAFSLTIPYSGVAPIINDRPAAKAVYYNMLGNRVEHPTKGVFIRVENGRSTKVTI